MKDRMLDENPRNRIADSIAKSYREISLQSVGTETRIPMRHLRVNIQVAYSRSYDDYRGSMFLTRAANPDPTPSHIPPGALASPRASWRRDAADAPGTAARASGFTSLPATKLVTTQTLLCSSFLGSTL